MPRRGDPVDLDGRVRGEMSGSSPDPDAVTASAGICDTGTWSNAAICFCRCLISWTKVGLVGPRLDADEKSGSQP